MNSRKILFILFTLVLAAISSPALADNTNIIDNTLSQFNVVAQDFGHKTTTFAWRMLLVLSVIQLSVNGIKWALKQVDFTELVGGITNSIFAMGVFAMFIQNPTILHVPIDYFTAIGQAGSGLPNLTPSTLIKQGIQLSSAMISAFNAGVGANGDILSVMKNILPNLYLFAASIVVIASFAVIAFQMFLVLVQSYMWFCLTPVFVGFGGLVYTRDIAMNALKGGITIGAKILAVYFVAGLARGLAPVWATSMGDLTLTNWEPLFNVAIGAAGIAYLALKIPALAGDMVNGTSSMSASDVGSTLVAGAAGGAAGGGIVASMTSAAAKAAATSSSGLSAALGAGTNALQEIGVGGSSLNSSTSSSSNTPAAPSSSSPSGSSPAAPSSSSSSGSVQSGSTTAPSSSSPAGNSPAAPSSGSTSSVPSSSSATTSNGAPSNSQAETTPSNSSTADNSAHNPSTTQQSETVSNSSTSADSGTSTVSSGLAPPAELGNASTASIGSSVSPPSSNSSLQDPMHKRVQQLQGYIPQDGGTVGLNASLTHQTD